jgi:hypothetical protein
VYASKGDCLETIVDDKVFTRLLRAKERELVYTVHSIQQAKKRGIIQEHEETIARFENDLRENTPHKVTEQDSEDKNERKFKVYYPAPEGGYMAYILVLNARIRLLTLYLTTKKLLKQVYRYRRRLGPTRQRKAIKTQKG